MSVSDQPKTRLIQSTRLMSFRPSMVALKLDINGDSATSFCVLQASEKTSPSVISLANKKE